jgi:hypothetical protein
MNTQIIDISANYIRYNDDEISLSELLYDDLYQLDCNKNICLMFDDDLSLRINKAEKEYNNKTIYEITLMYKSYCFNIIYNFTDSVIPLLLQNSLDEIFNSTYLSNVQCEIFLQYEKLFNDFQIKYSNYIPNHILHGNIILDINHVDKINFIAENNFTMVNSNNWFENFENIKSPIIHVHLNRIPLKDFSIELLNFSNNTLKYLMFTCNFIYYFDFYKLLKNNFSELICIIIHNDVTCHGNDFPQEKIDLINLIYTNLQEYHTNGFMRKVKQLLHEEPLIKNANKI